MHKQKTDIVAMETDRNIVSITHLLSVLHRSTNYLPESFLSDFLAAIFFLLAVLQNLVGPSCSASSRMPFYRSGFMGVTTEGVWIGYWIY
jgi:hypothetical protein